MRRLITDLVALMEVRFEMHNSEIDNSFERNLVNRIKAGDEAAFSEIIERYQRPVLDFVYRMVGDPDIAQDIAQDVFVRVWRGIDRFKFRRHAAFSTWLFQIARNRCLDTFRRRTHDPLHAAITEPIGSERRSSDSVARDVSAREIGDRIAAAVASLPEEQRTAMILAEYEGLSRNAIAGVMRCTVKSVDARLYRARQALRDSLRDLAPSNTDCSNG